MRTAPLVITLSDLRALVKRFDNCADLHSEKTTYASGATLEVFRDKDDIERRCFS